jgi:hypothetical protein
MSADTFNLVIPGRLRLYRRRTRLRWQDCQRERRRRPKASAMEGASQSILPPDKDQDGFRVPPANSAGGPGMTTIFC